MPIQHGIYYEKQVGGLCRLHSINAFFGENKYSVSDFDKYSNEYDNEYKNKYNITSSCSQFDLVSSNQENIVSYILKKNKVYTRYFALNQLKGNINDIILEMSGKCFFQYNENHIWCIINKDNKWYKVDSIGGVRPVHINSINQKNTGFIIPIHPMKELERNKKIIKNILVNCKSKEDIKNFLIQLHQEKKILGELEVPLNIYMDILEIKFRKVISHEIKKHIISYNNFLRIFTKGNYNNIELIKSSLVDILYYINN